VFTWLLSSSALRADDEIILKSRKFFGIVKSENSLGITLEAKKEFIPAGEIVDIRYDKKQGDPSREFYFPARDKDGSLDKAKDRQSALLDAIRLYDETLKKIPKEADQDMVRRNVEFRIAYLRGRLAVEFRTSPTTALTALKAYKDKHANSWQITQCLLKLAELQIVENKIADAEKTYAELSQANVAEEVKQEADMLAAQLGMKTGNYAQALTRLQAIAGKLPKNSPVAVRAMVAQAECLTLTKKTDDANKLLRQLLKDSSSADKSLRAQVHNALGKNLYDQRQFKEARWEFLWVDVVYNQDKAEHAKSLYYLWHAFKELNENERAQECLETLLSESFAGQEFQRKAQSESKK
jgi:hypothetical protein